MKKIIAVFLSISLAFSFIVSVHADESSNFDEKTYNKDVYDNYNSFIENNWDSYFKNEEMIGYYKAVNKSDNNVYTQGALNFASCVLGEELSKDKYLEILSNLLTMMEYEYSEYMSRQGEIDSLKTVAEYAQDVGDIIIGTVGFDKELTNGVTDAATKQMGNIQKAIELDWELTSITIDTVDKLQLYNKTMVQYNMYNSFLTSIINFADDANLKEAAKTLHKAVGYSMQFKLEQINDTTENIAMYLGKDMFLDTVVQELAKDPENITGIMDVDVFNFLNESYNKFDQLLKNGEVTLKLGIFAGDMLFGTTDVFIRYNEMLAMKHIREALVKDIDKRYKSVSVGDNEEIEYICQQIEGLIYVDSRGNYCMYNLCENDGQLLSLLNLKNYSTFEGWFDSCQSVSSNLLQSLNWIFPEVENYYYDLDEWKDAYINFVNEHGNVYDSFGHTMETYKLVNINNDSIPELYINFGTTAGGDVICTYYEGKVVEQPLWNHGFSYVEGQNIFRDSGGHMDVYHDKIYSIKNGQFILLHEGDFGASDNSHIQLDSDGNPIYNYYWNGTEVSSEAEYMNLLNEVYNTQHAVTPFDGAEYNRETWRYVGNGLCDYGEIIEAINAY